jgi:tripeptidyl-peptidase-1
MFYAPIVLLLVLFCMMSFSEALHASHLIERMPLRSDWKSVSEAHEREELEVVFALKHDTALLEKRLMDVSTPGSKDFHKFLSRDELREMVEDEEATTAVVEFLKRHGASVTQLSGFGEYITAKAPVSVWSGLFDTEFYRFENPLSGYPLIRAKKYSLPTELATLVSGVHNVVSFPPPFAEKRPIHAIVGAPSGTVTPSVINQVYNINSNTGNEQATQSLFESLGQTYSPEDLTTFQDQYNLPEDPVDEVIGGHDDDATCSENANDCAEANLDVQYLMAVSQLSPTTYWYVDNPVDPFLAWILAVADTENPPLVHSISYGGVEKAMSSSQADSFNVEAMKLGLQGVSIFVSSGDDGAPGNQARYMSRKCSYSPSFPATSPYVTAVGATQGPESNSDEIACQSNEGGVITTGGGFSTLFEQPSYQSSAVSGYFSGLSTSEQPVDGYEVNNRGYPDVSMLGYNYEVVIAGKTYAVSGTSASAPVFAGVASLINAARLESGKSALGFLNPALYSSDLASSYNDITEGHNKCTAGRVCCDEGFYASSGWDPVTGLGSVDYSKFYDALYNM